MSKPWALLAPYAISSICAILFHGAAYAQNSDGTQPNTLQVGTQSTSIQGGASGSLIQAGIEREAGPVNILIILDCSYSMKEKLADGSMKMAEAKAVLQSAMSRIPSDVNVGLRVFGQGFAGVMMNDCNQTALLVPLGLHNRASIISRVNRLEPFGMTPLTYAIQEAAESDFRGVQGPKTLILITDGADTCNGNPCAYVRSLPYRGIKLKVDVVGVDLKKDPHGREQLNCISALSGGKYYGANTAADLIDSVSKSVDTAISGRVLPHAGTVKNGDTPVELHPIPVAP